MARNATIGLGINVDSKSLKEAATNTDKLTDSTDKLVSELSKVAQSNAPGALSAVSTKAGIAVGAVTTLVAGVISLAGKSREAAREMNQGLLDAIEDAARGSENATEQFEDLENAMRNVRGRSDLLARGYSNLEDATEDATGEFIRNEAIVRDIDQLLPRFKESITNLAFDAYRSLRGEVLEVNEALIEQELQAAETLRSLERLSEEFGEGFGIERVAAVIDNLATSSEDVREGFEILAAELGEATNEELDFIATTNTLNLELAAVAANMVRTGQITEDAANSLLAYTNTERSRTDVLLMVQGFLEENTALENELADARESSSSAGIAQEERRIEIAAALADAHGTLNEIIGAGFSMARSGFDALNSVSGKYSDALRSQIELEKELRDIAGQQKMEGAEKLAEAMDSLPGKFEQLSSLGGQALSVLGSGLEDLSLAAVFRKDGNAIKEFGKSLGQMLVQLGTMAVVYAGVAALGAVFPALQPLVGPAAAAPALAAAGAVAIAAGAGLGAVTGGRGAKGRGEDSGGGGSTVETSRTTIYNVQLGAGMSRRGMNRTLIEQVGSAVEQGV